MKKNKLSALLIKLSLLTLTFTSVGGVALITHHNEPIVEVEAWSGTQTPNIGTYYASITADMSGNELKSKLKTIISSPFNASYNWSRYEALDETEGDSSKVLLIYSRINDLKSNHVSGTTGWNREHTFPQSKMSSPATEDNHIIFADDNKTNSTRGNKEFADLKKAGTRVKDGYGNLTDNYTNNTYFEPNDEAKPEVAWATLYANVKYDYSITNNFDKVETALEWAIKFPVTNRHIFRNNKAQQLQGNRNPFVDDPSYACRIWGDTNSATKNLCSQYSTPPTSITLSETSLTINVGDSATLSATLLPLTASQSVTWTSSNQSIVKVNNGVLTPVAAGTATVTATSTVDSSISASATITVTNIPVAVTGLNVNESSIDVSLGGKKQITASVTPSSATNKNLSYLSNDTSIAVVSESGLVTGVSVGSTSITITTVDGGYSKNVAVNVSEVTSPEEKTPGSDWKRVTSLSGLTSDGYYVFMGGSASKFVMSSSNAGKFQNKVDLAYDTNATDLGDNEINGQSIVWQLVAGSSNGYYKIHSLKDGEDGYLSYYNDNNNTITYNNIAQEWSFSYSGGLFMIENVYTRGRYLQYNSGSPRFVAYLAKSNQIDLSIYKYEPTVSKVLTGISVTSSPNKTVYEEGETFSPVGLMVTASYSDGTTKIVTPSYSTAPLTAGTTSITLTYKENGVSQTTNIPITVNAKVVEVAEGLYTISTSTINYISPLNPTYLTIGKGNSKLGDLTFTDIDNTRLNSSPNSNKTIVIGGNDTTGGKITITLPDGLIATSISFNGLLVDSGNTPTLTINDGNSFTYSGKDNETLYPYANSLKLSTIGTSRIWMSSIMISAKTTANAALEYGTRFLNATGNECANSNVTTSTWASLTSLYNNADQSVKDVIKASSADANGNDLENAIARYNIIVSKYNYQDFIGTGVNNSIANHRHNNEQKSLAVLGITALTLSAIGFYLFKNKKKKDDIN